MKGDVMQNVRGNLGVTLGKRKPPVYVFAALVAMLAAHLLVPIALVLVFPWNLIGLAPLFLGAALAVYAIRLFATHKTTPEPFGRSGALVTDGPFRVTRNPMYLGILVMVSGVAALFGTAGPWLVVPVLGFLLDAVFVRREEEKMELFFGDAYRNYKNRVRRWI